MCVAVILVLLLKKKSLNCVKYKLFVASFDLLWYCFRIDECCHVTSVFLQLPCFLLLEVC